KSNVSPGSRPSSPIHPLGSRKRPGGRRFGSTWVKYAWRSASSGNSSVLNLTSLIRFLRSVSRRLPNHLIRLTGLSAYSARSAHHPAGQPIAGGGHLSGYPLFLAPEPRSRLGGK